MIGTSQQASLLLSIIDARLVKHMRCVEKNHIYGDHHAYDWVLNMTRGMFFFCNKIWYHGRSQQQQKIVSLWLFKTGFMGTGQDYDSGASGNGGRGNIKYE